MTFWQFTESMFQQFHRPDGPADEDFIDILEEEGFATDPLLTVGDPERGMSIEVFGGLVNSGANASAHSYMALLTIGLYSTGSSLNLIRVGALPDLLALLHLVCPIIHWANDEEAVDRRCDNWGGAG
jgi:hypothetical protein